MIEFETRRVSNPYPSLIDLILCRSSRGHVVVSKLNYNNKPNKNVKKEYHIRVKDKRKVLKKVLNLLKCTVGTL